MRCGRPLALALCVLAVCGLAAPTATGFVAPDQPGVSGLDASAGLGVSAFASDESTGIATHGNHVTIDPQVSGDGTVVAETVSTLTPSFVVVRTDDDGRPGDPVGHTFVETPSFRTNVGVEVDPDTWREWTGNRTLWLVLHADDGDGEFDPKSDLSLASRAPTAETSFTLGNDDNGDVRVLAREFDAQTLRNGTLTARQVDLATQGYLVATPVDDDRSIGHTALGNGSHRNVTLALDDSFVADQRDRFRIRLLAYRDDGDGRFGDGDRPVYVGNDTVGTSIVVQKEAEREPDATATTEEPQKITSSPTATPTATVTATTTESVDSTLKQSPTATTRGTTTRAEATVETGSTGPGFGVGLAIAALLLLVVALGRRRR